MTVARNKPTPEEILQHHGVKGMKWGVTRSDSGGGGGTGGVKTEAARVKKNIDDIHTAKVNKAIRLNTKVAQGKGTFGDKARVVAASGGGRLLLNGVKGTARKNAADQKAHLRRLETGNAKVSDVLQKYGSLTYLDLANAAIKGRNV